MNTSPVVGAALPASNHLLLVGSGSSSASSASSVRSSNDLLPLSELSQSPSSQRSHPLALSYTASVESMSSISEPDSAQPGDLSDEESHNESLLELAHSLQQAATEQRKGTQSKHFHFFTTGQSHTGETSACFAQ